MKLPTRDNPQLASIISLALMPFFASMATNAQTIRYDNLSAIPNGADVINSIEPLFDSFKSGSNPERLVDLRLGLSGTQRPGTVSIALYGDSNFEPGTYLTTLGTLDGQTLSTGNNAYQVPLLTHPLLDPNTRYWIVVTDTGSSQWVWSEDDTGIGVSGERFGHQTSIFDNAGGAYLMQLSTGPISVPDTANSGSLLAATLLGLALARRKLA